MSEDNQILEHILTTALKEERRLKVHFDPDLTHILVDRSYIIDTHNPGLSGRCFILLGVHKGRHRFKKHVFFGALPE